jgi:hypothetical protein
VSQTSFLTIKEEHSLRVFENRRLKKQFGPERAEVTGGRREPRDEGCDVGTDHQISIA